MTAICKKLLNRLILWHGTSPENTIEISKDGFRPAEKSGLHTFRQAVWFYHTTPAFNQKRTHGGVGFILAIDLNSYKRVGDYVHEMDNTLVFKVPLPSDLIVAQLDFNQISTTEDLCEALNQQWQCNVISEFLNCCCDARIPWHQKKSIAEMLWSLSPKLYFEADVLKHLLVAEVPGLSSSEAARLISLLKEKAPRFLEGLLHLYHRVFLTPRFARATMLAAVKCIAPTQVLAAAEGTPLSESASVEAAAVIEFITIVLPQLTSDALVRGAIEIASMRRFPGDDEDLKCIRDWVTKWALEAEEVAFHYLRFAGDTYPTRHTSSIARDLAVRILTATETDYYDRLMALSDTDYLETLNGIMHAFSRMKEVRAVPFLASRLKDKRKMHRVAAIHALGQIGTPDALQAVQTVSNDKRKVVQEAIRQVFCNST